MLRHLQQLQGWIKALQRPDCSRASTSADGRGTKSREKKNKHNSLTVHKHIIYILDENSAGSVVLYHVCFFLGCFVLCTDKGVKTCLYCAIPMQGFYLFSYRYPSHRQQSLIWGAPMHLRKKITVFLVFFCFTHLFLYAANNENIGMWRLARLLNSVAAKIDDSHDKGQTAWI